MNGAEIRFLTECEQPFSELFPRHNFPADEAGNHNLLGENTISQFALTSANGW